MLVDLLMPASGESQGQYGNKFVGQEMPIGIFLALLAAKNGAKYVAVFTDTNHHQHPASACFDAISCGENYPQIFKVADAKVVLCNSRGAINHYSSNDLSRKLTWREVISFKESKKPITSIKDWYKVLDYLLGKIDCLGSD